MKINIRLNIRNYIILNRINKKMINKLLIYKLDRIIKFIFNELLNIILFIIIKFILKKKKKNNIYIYMVQSCWSMGPPPAKGEGSLPPAPPLWYCGISRVSWQASRQQNMFQINNKYTTPAHPVVLWYF